MRRTVKHVFKSKEVITDITGHLPNSCKTKLSYAKAEKIVFKEGYMYIQYFSHYLFLFEHITIELHSDLEAGYKNEKNRLFLFMMLKGKISFFTADSIPITQAEANTCYATYNRRGEFHYHLAKGSHQFCHIMPRTAWLGRDDTYYPRIGQFLRSMKSDRKLFGHMSPCTIDKGLHRLLEQLFDLNTDDLIELEISIIKSVKEIINHYQLLLDEKYASRVYLMKQYIDKNYTDIHLSNKTLADHYFTTEKTLIQTFKQEFGITPHNYLIQTRMEKAKSLIIIDKILPSQVYQHVGYIDFRSFRKQFKKHFGTTPSHCC